MTASVGRRALPAIGIALAAPWLARAAEPVRLRVSVESLPTHARTRAAADFCRKVEQASHGAITTQLFHSAQLFTDQTVVTALVENQVEMSIPGTWGVTGFVPSVDVMQLPAMYARPVAVAHRVLDGQAGTMIGAEVERKLRLRVLGRWLDLGFENWYGTARRLGSLDDLRGLKIRNSGGAGKAWRTAFFGAIPNTTPWPSVPLALTQGTFDGVITTNETVSSASLWEANIHSVLEDHQTFNAYLPLVAGAFWRGLTDDQRKLLTDVWEANVDGWRANMAAAQAAARDNLIRHGVVVTVAEAAQVEAARTRMLTQQDALVKQWRILPEIAARAVAEAGASVGQ